MEKTIDFIRHGEPVGGRRYRGSGIDDPLSDDGWRQMWQAVPDSPLWDKVVSSPMKRCHPFAEAVGARFDLPVRIEARLSEIGFGVWEGMTPAQVIEKYPAEYDAFYKDPVNRRPTKAEPLEAFSARISSVFDELVDREEGKHLLVVAHAGVIRAALKHVLGWPAMAWYKIRVDNGAVTRFRKGRFGVQLEFHNLVR